MCSMQNFNICVLVKSNQLILCLLIACGIVSVVFSNTSYNCHSSAIQDETHGKNIFI